MQPALQHPTAPRTTKPSPRNLHRETRTTIPETPRNPYHVTRNPYRTPRTHSHLHLNNTIRGIIKHRLRYCHKKAFGATTERN
jgi:hypothetical protein